MYIIVYRIVGKIGYIVGKLRKNMQIELDSCLELESALVNVSE